MKPIITIVLFCLISLLACKEEKKPKPEPPPIIPTVTAPELHGSWVKAAYIQDLKITKSPMKSFSKLNDIAIFSFDTARLKGDTLAGSVSYGGHEGSGCVAFFKSGKTPRSILIKIQGDTVKIPHELVLTNNELLLMSYPSNGSAIAEKYVKMNEIKPNIDSALSVAVRSTLFKGRWQLKEMSKEGKSFPIEILENGTIKGSEVFSKFDILTDYAAEPTNADVFFLSGNKTKKQRIFQYKISGDTLKLFEKVKKKEVVVFQLLKLK